MINTSCSIILDTGIEPLPCSCTKTATHNAASFVLHHVFMTPTLGSALHLGLDFLVESLELIHAGVSGLPANAKAFLLTRLGYHVKMNVVDLLVSNGAIVLEDIIVSSTSGSDELLDSRQDLAQLVIRDVMKLCAVVLGDDKCVSLAEGPNVKESKSLVAFEELEGRDLALDNTAEDAGHICGSITLCVSVSLYVGNSWWVLWRNV